MALEILLVEDDDVDEETVSRMLAKFAARPKLTVAPSLAQARARLKEGHFDCVLLDYRIVGEVGLDLVPDVIRHRQEVCPVILISALESESLVVEAMRTGVVDYVSKSSLTLDRLRVAIDAALARAKLEQAELEFQAREEAAREESRARQLEALRNAALQAKRDNRAKGMFVANMSHEIRTPLNAVIGLSYLLQRTELSADQLGLVDRINVASRSLLIIINNVLDLSKLGADAIKLESVPFNCERAIWELVQIVSVHIGQRDIHLNIEGCETVPPTLIGDPVRLHQVLLNLLTNAIKFTERGTVHLRVKVLELGASEARIRFEVEDNGIGMDEAMQAVVFAPFAQADTSTTRLYGGTGLGLSIARELVRLMGGEIQVTSRLGEGALFWFEVNFGVSEVAVAEAIHRPPPGAGSRLSGVRALVVDDSDVNLEVAKTILEIEDATVHTASNGQEAVTMVLADPKAFDIILMDLQMPILDGHDAFRRISGALGDERPKVIALTAGSLTKSTGEVHATGMDDLVHKPFDVDHLVVCIRKHLQITDGGVPQAASLHTAKPAAGWPPLAGIDVVEASHRMGENKSLFASALQIFMRQYRNLDGGLAADDLDEARRALHRLKGSAGTIGAMRLRELAEEAEALCKRGDAEGAIARLRGVRDEIAQLCEAIPGYLGDLGALAA